jgi:hypothetical protein
MQGDISGPHWQSLAELPAIIPRHHGGGRGRRPKHVVLGRCLQADEFPALHSHATASVVQQMLTDGLERHPVPRLSRAGGSTGPAGLGSPVVCELETTCTAAELLSACSTSPGFSRAGAHPVQDGGYIAYDSSTSPEAALRGYIAYDSNASPEVIISPTYDSNTSPEASGI